MVGPQLPHLSVPHLLEKFDRQRQLPDILVCARQIAERGEGVGVISPQLLHLGVPHPLEESTACGNFRQPRKPSAK